MKKMYLKFFVGISIIFLSFALNGQNWQKLDNSNLSNETKISLLTSKSSQIKVEFDFSAYALKEVTTPNGIEHLVVMPKCSRTKTKGAPDLPKISQAVSITSIADMKLNIVESEFVEFDNINIAPSKGVLSRNIDPASIEYEYGATYSKNEMYPSEIAVLNDPYIIRNVRGQNIMVYPVQYNPMTKKVRIYTKVIVELTPTGNRSINTLSVNPNIQNDDVFENVISNHFLNYTHSLNKYTPLGESGKNMLIVCYSDFMDEMAEYVSWKESIGFTVNLVDYATIGSSSALKTYVQNQYDQNGISYLLIIGDHAQVPSSSTSAGDSDNNYGYTSGSDHYLDIFVGRFSAENASQLQTQIDRSIYYERDVNSSDTWFKNGIGIASNEGTGGGGDDGESDEQHMNNIETDLEGYGYTINRCYQDGGSTSEMSSLINSGAGLINYVGHGSNYSWAAPSFTTSNVGALTNNNELPFVISVACVVGNFTSITCFAESWLRATNGSNPTGAVVFCGSTINQSWASPMSAQDEMVDLLVANSYITYGGMFVNGVFQMIDEYGSDGENMADTWTVFGDPSIQMRTPGHPDGPDSGVVNPPTANFSAASATVSQGEAVSFTSLSSGNPSSYAWTFEGGTPSTSTEKNPTVTYNSLGNYNVSLTVSNEAGTDTETKSNYITVQEFVPTYCSTQGNDYSYEWIASVTIGTFENASSAAGYTDYTNQSIEMVVGTDYNVALTPGFASSTYNEYWKIWVDLNLDGDFDDSGELIFDAGSLSKTTVTGTASIPTGTEAKTTRLRVSMKYNGAQTSCESFNYGEVEDYTVVIVESGDDTEAPSAPTNLASSNIEEISFTLSWTASTDNVGVTEYEIFQGGSSIGTVTATTASITGLTASTTYSFYVKAKDAAGNVSSASSSLSVTTATPPDTEAPTVPTNLQSTNVTSSSITLSWTASSDNVGVTGYDIYQNDSYFATSLTTSYNVTGLSASTTYSYSVKAKDAAGNVSSSSSTLNVTTDVEVISYCASQGNNANYEWIAGVAIGSFNNTSGTAKYTDYTSMTVNVESGNTAVTLTPGFASSTYNEYWKIWIDLNTDGDFDDANELVFDAGSMSNTTVSGTMTIPASAEGVTSRMRVSMKYNGAQTACESFSYGEVEDYTVSIAALTPDTEAPTAPTNLAAGNVTQTTLTLTWNAATDNVGVTEYEIFQGGSSIGTATGTSSNISSLTASTTYSFYVIAKDAAGNVSNSSNTVNITTLDESITYCSTQGNNVNYEWIDLVQINEINNSTGSNGGYADFTNMVANVTLGATETINFSCGFNSSSYTEYWHVWIDWDHSGTFDSDEEMVTGSSSSANTLTADFTVPSDALLGNTRMRVTMKYNAAATSCETFSYGEVEDYTINVGVQGAMARSQSTGTKLGNEAPTSLVIYPNPANDYVNVHVTNGNIIGIINIYDINGSLMKVSELEGNVEEINISDLPRGTYLISVEDERSNLINKFIKQ